METVLEHEPITTATRKKFAKRKPEPAVAETVEMAESRVPVPASLLETIRHYRAARGEIKTKEVLRKAAEAYASGLIAVFEKDEEFQLSVMEVEERKGKKGG
jgi:hypothetical protein